MQQERWFICTKYGDIRYRVSSKYLALKVALKILKSYKSPRIFYVISETDFNNGNKEKAIKVTHNGMDYVEETNTWG